MVLNPQKVPASVGASHPARPTSCKGAPRAECQPLSSSGKAPTRKMVLVRWVWIRYAGFSVWLALPPTKAYEIAGIVPALVERCLMAVRTTPVTKGLRDLGTTRTRNVSV